VKNLIRVEIDRLAVEPRTLTHLVFLREEGGRRVLPIAIGVFEAEAIARAVGGIEFHRPLTHNLLKSVIEHLGGRLERVVVNDLREDTFYARLIIIQGKRRLSIDARPSDSICLAALTGAPIFVSAHVMAKAGVELPEEEGEEGEGGD